MRRPLANLEPRVRAQLEAATALAADVLGADLAGVHLYGSAVVGGLRPDSDLDLFVLSRRRTSPAEKRRLIAALLPISGRHAADGPARSIELTIVAEPDVQPWRYPPRVDFQYGDWLRTQFERGELAPWDEPNPDLAILLETARRAAIALVGPPLRAVLPSVPRDDLVRASVDGIPGLLDDLDGDTRNVLLTLARIWTTVATGEIRPKDAAADWAIERLPAGDREILGRARDLYVGFEPGPDRWSERMSSVRAVAASMVEAIGQLIAA